MARTSPNLQIREYAQRIVAYGDRNPSLPSVAGVFDGLRQPLSALVGVNGLYILLKRALVLAAAESPLLRAVEVQHDGSVKGLKEIDPAEVREAGISLLAHVLALLVAFIGEGLMLQIMLNVWPALDESFTNVASGESKDDPER